jgi:predicted nuclease of predicted toxin-antitoxin system
MTFLLDENLPPKLIQSLEKIGYHAIHVHDLQFTGKSDLHLVEYAEKNDYIIITHDLDYSRIISIMGRKKPSAITLRLDKINADIVFELLKSNLPSLKEKLEQGALVTISIDKIRFRYLPLERG